MTASIQRAYINQLGRALRMLPPEMRGKARLARALSTEKLRTQSCVVRTALGNMLLPNLLEPIGFHIWSNGSYEPETHEVLRSMLGPRSIFIDVGANIGAFTVALAPYCRTVLSIEASSQVFHCLEHNVRSNNLANVQLFNCAASDGGAQNVSFYEAPSSHYGMGSSAPQFGATPTEVPAVCLDSFFDHLLDCSNIVVKVDVEGYEASVFLGSNRLLDLPKPPVFVFEFCDWAETRAFPGQVGLAQVILHKAGYEIWRLRDYLHRQGPLVTPLTTGSDMLIAAKRNQHQPQIL